MSEVCDQCEDVRSKDGYFVSSEPGQWLTSKAKLETPRPPFKSMSSGCDWEMARDAKPQRQSGDGTVFVSGFLREVSF